MKMVRWAWIVILWGCAAAATATDSGRGVVEGRLVNRTDSSILPSGAELEIVELEGGMRTLQTAVADASARFRISGLTVSGRLMLRVIYQGVNYHSPLSFNPDGVARLNMEVFETTDSMKDIRVERIQMAFQLAGESLKSIETVMLRNTSRPPRIIHRPSGTFHHSKAPGILRPPVLRITAPGAAMPLIQPALESADGRSYYSLYPLRPGLTVIEVEQELPYTEGAYTYVKRFYHDTDAFDIGVLPKDMALWGSGLSKTETNPSESFAVYSSPPVKAGTEMTWIFSGGTPPQPPPEMTADTTPPEESRISTRPVGVRRDALIIGPLLLLGFILPLWYALSRRRSDMPNTADSRIRHLRECRDNLLAAIAKADEACETGTLEPGAHHRQREDSMRQLRRIFLHLKK